MAESVDHDTAPDAARNRERERPHLPESPAASLDDQAVSKAAFARAATQGAPSFASRLGAQDKVRMFRQLQTMHGNAFVQRQMQRAPASPAADRAPPKPVLAAGPAKGTAEGVGPLPAVAPGGPQAAPPLPAAAPTAAGPGANQSAAAESGAPAGSSEQAPSVGGQGGAPAGGSGPLAFLTGLQGTAPSDISQRLIEAGQRGQDALGAHQAEIEGQLPARPAPSGLPAGAEVAPPKAPDVPAPDVHIPDGGEVAPAGPANPAAATALGSTGATAVETTASAANVEVPAATLNLKPTVEPGELPAVKVEGAPPIAVAAPPLNADDQARQALDVNMSAQLDERMKGILAPASRASVEHASAVATTKAEAEAGVARAEGETKKNQEAATAGANTEVRQLAADWLKEKAGLVDQHQASIRSQAAQAGATAANVIAEANAAAKAKADEADKAQTPEQGDASTSLWDKIKTAGKNVISGVTEVAKGALGTIRSLIDAAKQRVVEVISKLSQTVKAGIDAAVKAIRTGVQRVSSAIGDALRKAQELVTRLAKTLAAKAKELWEAAAKRLGQLWKAIQDTARKALAGVKSAASMVAKGLTMIKEIVKALGSKMYNTIADAMADPQGKLINPIIAKVTPLAEKVPDKGNEIVNQQKAEMGSGAEPKQGAPIQRTIAREAPPGPRGEGFWAGVWRHMSAAGAHFKQHWIETLLRVLMSIVLLFPMLIEEIPPLWKELKGVWSGTTDGLDRLDHLLGVLRHIVNIVAGAWAFVGVWALLFAWAGTPILEALTLAAYEGISAGILAADLVVGAAQMTKAAFGATDKDVKGETRELYLDMFSTGAIGMGVTMIMLALGAIAQRFAKAIRAWRTAAAARTEAEAAAAQAKAPVAEPNPGTPKPPEPAPKPEEPNPIGEPNNVRPGSKWEPRPWEYPYQNPPNMVIVPKGSPLNLNGLDPHVRYLWVVDGEGNFRFAPERQNPRDFMKPVPQDRALTLKHGDLVPGEGGYTRGPARAGGEMHNARYPDGSLSDRWVMNNDSSYTFARVDANGNPLPWAPAESLEAVRTQLVAGGTPSNRLFTTDVLLEQRAPKPGK